MEMKSSNDVEEIALANYKQSEPWPDNDVWHHYTSDSIHKYVQNYLDKLLLTTDNILLNAGCGKTSYVTSANVIYMDIIKEYIDAFENYLVASIEKIPLKENTIDCIICVGSVINYADLQKALSEFSRILKPNGILILEFERSNSAEFLGTKKYGQVIFKQKYHYNHQAHYLWMYNEKFVFQLANYYNFISIKKYRFHCISSLFFRFGLSEEKAAKYIKFDRVAQPFSYLIAHNEIIIFTKVDP